MGMKTLQKFCTLGVAAFAYFWLNTAAFAQNNATGVSNATSAAASYPNKPVKIIIGFAAGGPLDQHARLWADKLQSILGQPIVIDYRAGAGGSVGAEMVAKSAPDGYTLLLGNTGTFVINPAVYSKLPYQTLKDFAPVARTAQQPLAVVVNPNLPVKTMAELIAYAKANPGKLNYGSAGNGGISHLAPEMIKQATGTFMVHIPYRGSAPAFTDLMAGQVQLMTESVPQAAQYHKQGRVRALAVTSAVRNVALPDIPTLKESGVKALANFELVGFYGVVAPAGTPVAIVNKLSDAFKQILETPEIRSKMITQGADPAFLNGAQFGQFIAVELPRFDAAVRVSGAKLD